MDRPNNRFGNILLGAGLMYFFDPDRGARRRKMLADQARSLLNQSDDLLSKAGRDLSNRMQGVMAETQSQLSSEDVPDYVLVERVRSKMGRVVSHPRAIEVTADQGRVTLSGTILAAELDNLLGAVAKVRGVKDVESQLDVHASAANVPALQGGRPRPSDRPELMQENWTPGTRLLVSVAGGGMAFYGLRRGDLPGMALGLAGLGMLARGVSNTELSRLIGVDESRQAVDIQKTVSIDAPVEQVFNFWSNYQNFPRFMSNLLEVRNLGGGRSHWVAKGPAGAPVEWDAVVTRYEPNQVLAWKSEPGSPIANAGIIHFEATDGGTRVDIKLSYNPPGGALGHAIALLFGADPKSEMDEDMVRLKSLLEEGKTSSAGQTVTREEIEAAQAPEQGRPLKARARGGKQR